MQVGEDAGTYLCNHVTAKGAIGVAQDQRQNFTICITQSYFDNHLPSFDSDDVLPLKFLPAGRAVPTVVARVLLAAVGGAAIGARLHGACVVPGLPRLHGPQAAILPDTSSY